MGSVEHIRTLALAICGAALLAAGCRSVETASQPSGLALRYHNAQYGLRFFLPAEWQGYLPIIQSWDAALWSADHQTVIGVERGAVVVLRNPRWRPEDPYQDVPIMVFTRRQWDALKKRVFFPYAGGVISEFYHTESYVFGIYSRYNADDSLKGWREAGDILRQNIAAHDSAPLYPE